MYLVGLFRRPSRWSRSKQMCFINLNRKEDCQKCEPKISTVFKRIRRLKFCDPLQQQKHWLCSNN